MSEVRIVAVGKPIPQGSKRIGKNARTGGPIVIDDNPNLRAWRHQVTLCAQAAHRGRPFDGPVTVDATFRLERPRAARDRQYPTVKPDADKLLRACLDSLSGVTYVDDAQVVGFVVRKLYSEKEPPGVTIVVKEVGG